MVTCANGVQEEGTGIAVRAECISMHMHWLFSKLNFTCLVVDVYSTCQSVN